MNGIVAGMTGQMHEPATVQTIAFTTRKFCMEIFER